MSWPRDDACNSVTHVNHRNQGWGIWLESGTSMAGEMEKKWCVIIWWGTCWENWMHTLNSGWCEWEHQGRTKGVDRYVHTFVHEINTYLPPSMPCPNNLLNIALKSTPELHSAWLLRLRFYYPGKVPIICWRNSGAETTSSGFKRFRYNLQLMF